MGNRLSGRTKSLDAKHTVESCPAIDISTFHKADILVDGQHEIECGDAEKVVIEMRESMLSITLENGSGVYCSTKFTLQWRSCNLGGARPWFVCSQLGCGRRAGKLYLSDHVLACRRCHKLVYDSQRENSDDRALRRLSKLGRRLGAAHGVAEHVIWKKPKGMHWRIYDSLYLEYRQAEQAAYTSTAERLGWIPRRDFIVSAERNDL